MAKSNLTIQVQIGNRSYPLTISAEEQESVLKAAEKINHDLKAFEETYKVRDQQDLLAMFSLQLASEHLKSNGAAAESNEEVTKGLHELNQLVTTYLDRQ